MGPQPHVFQYSLDWRFLLPLADSQKIFLLAEEDLDFNQALDRVGIHASQRLSLSDLKQSKEIDAQSFVIPFGLPTGWVSTQHMDQVEFYFSIRRSIPSGGNLLVGFNNLWKWRADPQGRYRPSTPQRVRAQLKQAGFSSIKMFGALPNLAIPEYIFDLDSRTIPFALNHRFRRKPAVLRVLHALTRILGSRSLAGFLPCYFAVATA